MSQEKIINLSGLVAVVTGGGRGIGRAIVDKLSQIGATVILTGRDETLLHLIAAEISTAADIAQKGCAAT